VDFVVTNFLHDRQSSTACNSFPIRCPFYKHSKTGNFHESAQPASKQVLQFTFVEIEDPLKPIPNKNGSFTKPFNHARQQVLDWSAGQAKIIPTLMDMYASFFDSYNGWDDLKDYRWYLVFGRRQEVESDRKRKER